MKIDSQQDRCFDSSDVCLGFWAELTAVSCISTGLIYFYVKGVNCCGLRYPKNVMPGQSCYQGGCSQQPYKKLVARTWCKQLCCYFDITSCPIRWTRGDTYIIQSLTHVRTTIRWLSFVYRGESCHLSLDIAETKVTTMCPKENTGQFDRYNPSWQYKFTKYQLWMESVRKTAHIHESGFAQQNWLRAKNDPFKLCRLWPDCLTFGHTVRWSWECPWHDPTSPESILVPWRDDFVGRNNYFAYQSLPFQLAL